MKFATDRKELVAALVAVKPLVPRAATRPILEHVRIDSRQQGVAYVAATDLETSLEVRIAHGSDSTSGQALVPLAPLLAFLKAAEGERVTLSHLGQHLGELTVKTELGEKLVLDAADLNEYPVLPMIPTDTMARVTVADLKLGLSRVLPAVAKDAGRYAMHTVKVELGPDDECRLIGTDGRRLALATMDAPEWDSPDVPTVSALLPRAAAVLLGKLLPKRRAGGGFIDEVAELAMGDDGVPRLGFRFGNIMLVARAVEGEFPRYATIIRDSSDEVVSIDVAEAMRRLKLVSAATTDDARAVRLALKDGDLTVSTKSRGRQASASLKHSVVKFIDEAAAEAGIAANPDYLIDGLKAAGTETVKLGWNDAVSPLQLTAPGYIYALMQMHITLED